MREQAAEHRAGRAAAESSLAALRAQLTHDVDRERAYGEQRLADAETRHSAQLAELRTELDQARRQSEGQPPSGPDTGADNDTDGGLARSGGGARQPRATPTPTPASPSPTASPAPTDPTTPMSRSEDP